MNTTLSQEHLPEGQRINLARPPHEGPLNLRSKGRMRAHAMSTRKYIDPKSLSISKKSFQKTCDTPEPASLHAKIPSVLYRSNVALLALTRGPTKSQTLDKVL